VLFGATSPDQVRANCAAAGVLARLAPDDLAELNRIGLAADDR
jgi:aryl-alcohol dehydrogenase-like predicted oxidoreductase